MGKSLKIQSLLLLIGTVFAWYNVVLNFIKFYNFEGTLFKIKDCIIPNPVTEPCFYGAIAFLLAFIWSIFIYKATRDNQTRLQHFLWWFLGAGTIFAWFNVSKEFVAFYSTRTGPVLGCSATPITNPFLTPCFTGASIFLISVVVSGYIYSKIKTNQLTK